MEEANVWLKVGDASGYMISPEASIEICGSVSRLTEDLIQFEEEFEESQQTNSELYASHGQERQQQLDKDQQQLRHIQFVLDHG